jgi:hypothetical protein
MAWTLDNDPWCKSGTKKGNCKDVRTGKPPDARSFGVDPAALFVAKQLVEANAGCLNRQCAAASMSALFHLVLGHNKSNVWEARNDTTPPPHSASTSRPGTVDRNQFGNVESDTLDMTDDKMFNNEDTCTNAKEIEYDRNHDTLQRSQCGVEEASNRSQYAFTTSEPVRLDTGTEYIKLPLGSYVKILAQKEDNLEVERIGGGFNEQNRCGLIPRSKVQVTPLHFVPPHFILADKLNGQLINLAQNIIDSEQPYFDAGPKCKFLTKDDSLKIKDIQQEYTNVLLVDSEGASLGFGKLRTCLLFGADIIVKTPNF